MPAERVQKILAKAGIASRRKAEELILEGLVTINGKIAKLGDKAEFGRDAVKVGGKLILQPEQPVYLAFYKPRGVISMLGDPEGRPSLSDYLEKVRARVFPIGRLDFNSEGLILLTNDGGFAERVQKSQSIARVYQVKIKGHPGPEVISRLCKGARIANRVIKPYSVRVSEALTSKSHIEVVLLGTGIVDLKSYFEMKGCLVEKIMRTAIGHITLKGLLPGRFRLLRNSQVEALLAQPDLGIRRLKAR